MRDTKHIIWSDMNLDLDEWRDDLTAEYPDADDARLYQIMTERNAEALEDERCNLDIPGDRSIVVIADLGLWNGRRMGYKMIYSGNIRDCLQPNADYNEWYVDRYGDLRCKAVHHDGTNFYLYRMIKNSATDAQIENLQRKLYEGTAREEDIKRITVRLGDAIGKVYGWSFPGRAARQFER